MSEIEFFLILIAIVLGLAVAKLLEGIYAVSESSQRYWVHTLWLANKLGQCILFFWSLRDDAVAGQFTQIEGSFQFVILMIVGPILFFLQALVLVGLSPTSESNWAIHFYKGRRRFFALNILALIVVGLSAILGTSATLFLPFGVLFALSILGFVSDNRTIHGVIACTATATVVVGVGQIVITIS